MTPSLMFVGSALGTGAQAADSLKAGMGDGARVGASAVIVVAFVIMTRIAWLRVREDEQSTEQL